MSTICVVIYHTKSCQKCSSLSFSERPLCFFRFINIVKYGPFVIFEKWTNYEISISMLSLHNVLWYISYFVKMINLSFFERPVYFFTSSILSKTLNFAHKVRGPYSFPLFQYCQKLPILSFSERPVYIFASSNLSKTLNFVIFWEALIFFSLFQFCHFLRGIWIFRFFNFVKNA